MLRTIRALVATALALTALSVAANGAAAASITFDDAGAIALQSLGKTTFGSGISFACNWTLSGSLSEGPIGLEPGAQLGSVTEVRIRECTGMAISAVLGLPWPIRYEQLVEAEEFEPARLLFTVEGFSFNISVFGGCINGLYSGDPALSLELLATEEANVYASALAFWLEEILLPFAGGNPICFPSEMGASGEVGLGPGQTVTIEP